MRIFAIFRIFPTIIVKKVIFMRMSFSLYCFTIYAINCICIVILKYVQIIIVRFVVFNLLSCYDMYIKF